ncbi:MULTISPECIES: type VI secretion system baseplate subunit TssF [unclassified Halomonas]|uniref:type VI secretion system baseplate subunit TssF n=1 Tax=unclassified Halomonas TaxID=2609666 RepID=UPI0020A03254|nr:MULTISPECIES: type VI secretion system baseplate subunit TssF [unclassified Halomonas]MCP1314010.1 type VI secretion system baseplate subunit TssF [Halomonas sp. 707D7]MCP1326992.1 type VI secretion system baseplate subunit TssF [Halomonas sp. 707D4]
MLNRYYRDELNFLKRQGREFAEANPGLSRFLSERSTDPDVERLLEGFAFLTGRMREKVEDEFPELTHSLIGMLWPNYLRPVPSMAVVQFTPAWHVLSQRQQVARGTELSSIPVEGTTCLFRTCHDVALHPLAHAGVTARHTRESSIVELALDVHSDQPMNELGLDSLRLHLGGDGYTARTLYLWMSHYLGRLELEVDGERRTLPTSALRAVGFEADQALLPYPRNVHQGYRILQEYLCFPEAFHFFDVHGLADVMPARTASRVTLRFMFKRPLPTDARLQDEHLALYCTPAINLFEHDAEPIDLTGERSEYRIRPSSKAPSHFEVFSVDEVEGRLEGSGGAQSGDRRYVPFESFQHQIERDRGRESLYYRARVGASLRGDGFDHDIAFVRGDEAACLGRRETISLRLTCSNRELPEQLTVGDICVETENSPTFAGFRNITRPTPVLRPAIDDKLLWVLISNLSLNYLSLLDRDALCAVLKAYDFRALVDRQAERIAQKRLSGIVAIDTQPVDRLRRGMPVRGLRSVMTLDQEAFGDEGSLYLFGSVLARFLSLYASINAFHELQVINRHNQERYVWSMQEGQQPLM